MRSNPFIFPIVYVSLFLYASFLAHTLTDATWVLTEILTEVNP